MHPTLSSYCRLSLARIKMGLSEGVPGSIRPDHNGRADYFGASVNKAARLMGAGERGGRERRGQGEWWEAGGLRGPIASALD